MRPYLPLIVFGGFFIVTFLLFLVFRNKEEDATAEPEQEQETESEE